VAHQVIDLENYLVIPSEIKIVVSPAVQNIWKESDSDDFWDFWTYFLTERLLDRGAFIDSDVEDPSEWSKTGLILAVTLCWDLLIPKMNPGATCEHLEFRSEGADGSLDIHVLMWIGRDGSGDADNAAATVPMSVHIPVPKDDEDLIITVTPTTIRPSGLPVDDSRREIRNAAAILINQEKFQSEVERDKVIRASLNERFRNIEALDPDEIVVNDPGPPKDLRGKKSSYSYSGWREHLSDSPQLPHYVFNSFSFHFTEATLWELHLPPLFIVTQNVAYRDPNQPAAAA